MIVNSFPLLPFEASAMKSQFYLVKRFVNSANNLQNYFVYLTILFIMYILPIPHFILSLLKHNSFVVHH